MKKILVFAAIIALTVVCLPYLTGRVAESVTRDISNKLNASPAQNGMLEITRYQRGLRTTQTTLSWTPPTSGTLAKPIVYNCEGSHGMISYAYQCQAQNLHGYTEFVNQRLDGVDPLTIGGEISVFGEATHIAELQAFEFQSEDGERISVGAGEANIVTDENLENIEIDGHFAGIEVQAENGNLVLEPMRMNGDLKVNQHQLVLGEFTVEFNGLSSSLVKDGPVRLKNLALTSVNKEYGETLSSHIGLKIESISQQSNGNRSQSTPLDFQAIQFDGEISGLNMAQFAVFNKRLQQLARQDAEQIAKDKPRSDRNAEWLALVPEIEELLDRGLTTEVNFSARHKKQPVTADLSIELMEKLKFSDFLLLTVQPKNFLNKIQASATNSIPAVMVDQNATASIAQSPLYVRQGEVYQLDLQAGENGISLNGNILTFEQFMSILINQNR